ncbi:MAG: hypothetical protein IJI97_00425 [Clostridia bacterium]|nr:hypothetical protein [Clostridia bacterium]
MTDRNAMAAELRRTAKQERTVCCICHTEDITTVRFDAEEGGWHYRAYCRACAERMKDHETELMTQAERARHRGTALLSLEGSA